MENKNPSNVKSSATPTSPTMNKKKMGARAIGFKLGLGQITMLAFGSKSLTGS